MRFPVRRGWFLGIPLPQILLPGSDSREYVSDGVFHFDVPDSGAKPAATEKYLNGSADVNAGLEVLVVHDRTSSSFFVSRRVRMDICRNARAGQPTGQAAYLGTVYLTGAVQHIALPVGQPLLLLIAFHESPLVGVVVNSTQRVPLTIRPGERYRLVTEYVGRGFDHRLDRVP